MANGSVGAGIVRPGPRNLITDVAGLRVGCAEDAKGLTGVTVVLPDAPVIAAADIRGGAPGTRETPAIDPVNLVDRIHAIVLAGGSVFGLDAASAVTYMLARRGIGFSFGAQPLPAPVIPAAVLFDLMNGGDKAWPSEPPYRALGTAALAGVSFDFPLGNAGAGMGAVAGQLKGGLGSASAVWNGYSVGALVAVNSVGSAIHPVTFDLLASPYAIGEEMGDLPAVLAPNLSASDPLAGSKLLAPPGANTTIAAVATDAALTGTEAQRLAIMATDGLGRALRLAHAPQDGDTIFALATERIPLAEPRPPILAALGAIAADCLTRAVGRAIWHAGSIGSWRSYRDFRGI
jgi:L-aminopeptidase/D-esterase-like protein